MARSSYKGPYVDPKLLKKIRRMMDGGGKKVVKTWARSSQVHPDMVGFTIAIHNGRQHVPMLITENMVGHRLGEFAPTRTFRVHSGNR